MIGLMDCNNFFVSCERLFRPDLLKRPVAVLSSNDGCIVSRSQEVKALGIPMGTPYFQVKELCKKEGVVLFSSNFTLYRDLSSRVMETLAREVGECEIYSIDEAFFEIRDDITEDELRHVRATVMRNVGIPVSIGAASTKTLAKEASEFAKKGSGVCILAESDLHRLKDVPCASVWGMGRKTVEKLKTFGVSSIGDFLALDPAVVRSHFGVFGDRIRAELQGTVAYPLHENSDAVRQSIMSSRSFEKTTRRKEDIESALAYHVSAAASKLREKGLLASKIYLSISASRHGDFFMRRGSTEIVLDEPSADTHILIKSVLRAVSDVFDPEVPYKKASVVMGGLIPQCYATGDLFTAPGEESSPALSRVLDMINDRYGHNTIRSGVIRQNGPRTAASLRSPEYSTRWKDIPSVHAI